MATSGRDARRRRIADGGSDRLALITGRIQSLPSSSTEPFHSHTASCPSDFSEQFTAVSPLSEDKTSSVRWESQDSGGEPGLLKNYEAGGRVEPVLRKCETSVEAYRVAASELDGISDPPPVSSTVPNSSISTSEGKHHFQQQSHHQKIFTPTQISSAIASSQRTRLYFSLAAAIVVVLSYIGFPIVGSRIIQSIVLSRPLYLVLLTNISIVLARLLSERQTGVVRAEKESSSLSAGEYGFADQLGKALESGLVIQSVVAAVFMDVSVYAIVVVCGLSLAQRLFW